MPRSSKDRTGSRPQQTSNPEFKGFIDFTVSDREHEKFNEWVPTVEEVLFWRALMKRLDSGYKVSISADKVNECYITTLICNAHDNPDAGWCLTARDDTVFGSLMLLFWKDEVLLKGSWVKNVGDRGRRNFG